MPVSVGKLLFSVAGLVLALASTGNGSDFALKDGDTVVFLGDSITAARTYGQIIENYTLLRFPDRRVRFFNSGWGGDTAAGGAARLERDVFSRGASVVTVAYGMNDIGWGALADDEHKQKYLDGIRSIVGECRKRKVRVFICSAAITAEDPQKSEEGYLQTMCDEGLAIARDMRAGTIDVQRSMRTIQRRVWKENESLKDAATKTSLHAADGVHLNELGQLAMAFAILKGWDAPADVSSATVDTAAGAATQAVGCRISDVHVETDGLEFTRLDEGLPINLGLFGALNFRFVPVHLDLNRYLLSVVNLPEGTYALAVDGREVGAYRHDLLAGGINISSATTNAWQPGGPWDAQATALASLTEARSRLAVAELMWNVHLPGSRDRPLVADTVVDLDSRLLQLQRTVARPIPYRYRLTKTK